MVKRKTRKTRKAQKSRKGSRREKRQRKQKGGDGSTALLDGDYPVTAKLPSGEIGDPDSIPTVVPKELYETLTGAADDEAPPS